MGLRIRLQKTSEWLKEMAEAAKGTIQVTVESGLLKDSLKDLCEQVGAAGAVFKLAAMSVPGASAEQRIAVALSQTFVRTLDSAITARPNLASADTWKRIAREHLDKVAAKTLNSEFTWLEIFGPRGRKASRSWPLVAELADFGRALIAQVGTIDQSSARQVQQAADDIRGILHDSLAKRVDDLVAKDTVVRQALATEQPLAGRDALELLAERLATLDSEHLFGETPQNAIYVEPTLVFMDYAEAKAKHEDAEAKSEKIRDKHEDVKAEFGNGRWLTQKIVTTRDSPRIIVIEGEMGIGKSCLMRVLVSCLSRQFCSDKRQPLVFVRWRDVYDATDLVQAIADHLYSQYRLPLHDLANHEGLVYFLDGFDEMSSHQESHVITCFDRLVRLVERQQSTVVVAMRSTLVTGDMRLKWKEHGVLVVRVREFSDGDVDVWAANWCAYRGVEGLTGSRLRSLCRTSKKDGETAARNPLLLYMLARYVHPLAGMRGGQLSRAEVFRIFVDETIRGKARTSGETHPILVKPEYRLVLQEMAYIASFPRHGRKCPEREVRERFERLLKRDFRFEAVRTAFILHFFEPGGAENECEFQPDGFRQYLLAEWCIRAQFDALLNRDLPAHGLSRSSGKAMDALAQFPLVEMERDLLNELYEELPRLAEQGQDGIALRFEAFGLKCRVDRAAHLVEKLYDRISRHVEAPPNHNWDDAKLGIPEGEEVPDSLNALRLLVNYWDQCLLAAFGLYRGLGKHNEKEVVFKNDPLALYRFLHTRTSVRGGMWEPQFDLSNITLEKVRLPRTSMRGYILQNVCLRGAELAGADFANANLAHADLSYANLSEASFMGADLSEADLTEANLTKTDLTKSNLRRAVLKGARLTEADLTKADLTKADLRDTDLATVNLTDATLRDTEVATKQLGRARGIMKWGSAPQSTSGGLPGDPG